MGFVNGDFKWVFVLGILNRDFAYGYRMGICMGYLNRDFKWGL